MMALSAAVVVPNVLRWYWWRMNGIGYAFGALAGIILSLAALFSQNTPIYILFPVICGASLATSILATLLTRPVDIQTLTKFYITVRPFGCWKPIREAAVLSAEQHADKSESPALAILNVLLGMVAIACIYLAPMYLVGHWYSYAWICLGIALVAILTLAFTWYRNLPPDADD